MMLFSVKVSLSRLFKYRFAQLLLIFIVLPTTLSIFIELIKLTPVQRRSQNDCIAVRRIQTIVVW